MTVTELVCNFRVALLGVLPAVENVKISWRDAELSDDWDNIASALFEALVIEPIRWSVAGDNPDELRMAAYDLLVPSYAGLGFLALPLAASSPNLAAFVALRTRMESFDTVEYRLISPGGSPVSQGTQTTALKDSEFVVQVLASNQASIVVQSISITDYDN